MEFINSCILVIDIFIMDIGHPLWFIKPRNKLVRASTSAEKITLYNELELVLTNILAKQSKLKRLRKLETIPTRITTNEPPSTSLNHEATVDDAHTFIPIDPAPQTDMPKILTPTVKKEQTCDPTDQYTTPDLQNLESIDQNTTPPPEDDQPQDSVSSSEEELLPDMEKDASFDVIDTSSDTHDEASSDSCGLTRHDDRLRTLTPLENLNKFKTVVNRLSRKVEKSLQTETNRSSRKYKVLLASQKILRILKYPIALACSGVGLYYMAQPYSELLALVATNSTSALASVVFSIISAFAGKFI